MTQLVELQEAMPKFEAAGIRLYAISYDLPHELAAFAKHHGITYRMLSDKGSKVIRSLGILNHHVTRDQVPFHGIPFPGTYVLDESGVVVEKLFHRNLAERASAESMIDGALGEILLGEGEPTDAGGDDDIRVSATYHGGGGTLKSAVHREVVVRFELAPGLHIYDEPVPEGMVATRIRVEGPEGLHVGEVEKPPTRPLALPGLDLELSVWDGRVDFVVPVVADDRVAALMDEIVDDEIRLDVHVDYQACDDRACHIPRRETLSLRVPVTPYTGHRLAGEMRGAVMTTMDARKLMLAKVRRALLRSPIKGLRYLRRSVDELRRGPAGRRSRSRAQPGSDSE